MGIFRNAASVLLTEAARLPLGLLAGVVLARFLTVEDRGYFAVATQIGMLVVVACQLGWPAAVIYRLRRAGSDPALVATTTLAVVLAWTLVVPAAGLALRRPLADAFLQGAPLLVLYLALASGPLQLLGLYFAGIARGLDRFALQNAYRLALAAGRLIAFALLLVLLGQGLLGALGGALAVQALAALGLTLAVVRHTGLRRRLEAIELRETARVGSKAWVHSVAGNLHERVDVFMLALLLPDHEGVAIYAIAAGVVEYLKMVPGALGQAALPQLTALEPRQAARLVAATLRHAIFWVLLSSLALAVAGPLLIPMLYGAPYAASVAPFLVLLAGVCLQTIYHLLARYFFSIDRQRVNIVVQLLALPLNVGLNLWMIPRWGVLGAAVASLISYSFEGVTMLVVFSRTSRLSWGETLVLRGEDVALYQERARQVLRKLGR